MTRTHGRFRRGKRLVAKVPHGRWRTMPVLSDAAGGIEGTFIAALRHDRITAPIVFDQPINGETFKAYVEQALVPTLTPGDVVVLDNLAATRARPSARRSARPAPTSCSCRPTAPTSTRSSRCSPNSKHCCERPMSAPSRQHGGGSAPSSHASHHTNAATTSSTRGTPQRDPVTL